jgi:Zn-dependent protease with chaperone function
MNGDPAGIAGACWRAASPPCRRSRSGRLTALDRYAKLEAIARYLDGVSPAAREVVLSFGERSLVIMGLDDRPIAHWPLASLRALDPPAQGPLQLVPDASSAERVLLEDREMRAAITEVCPRLHMPPAPARRKGRRGLRAAGTLILLALALMALRPPALPDSLADMVPPEREAALGEAVAARLPALLGAAAAPGLCSAEEGSAALRALTARIAPATGPTHPLRVSVLDHPGVDALALPGGRVVILRGLLDAARSPDEVAAVLAHAAGHMLGREPLRAALDRAGAGALTVLLFGDLARSSVPSAAATTVIARKHDLEAEVHADEAASAILAASGLPTRALADFAARLASGKSEPEQWLAAHPWSEERDRRARAADALGDGPYRPALGDRDWIALGNICERTDPARR